MPRLSILGWIGLACAAIAAAPAGSQAEKSRVILLFGARWCAPCMTEYKDLRALSSAAAPDRIVLAWIDGAISPPRDGVGVQSLPTEDARRLARRIGGEGYGLPFSAMADVFDNPCAVWRAPLRPGDIATLRGRCRRLAP